MNRTGIIILAAGNSSRLGRPKQLLPYQGKTLLSHVVSEALAAHLHPVVVVTGAYQAEIEDSLRGQPVALTFNPDWETGMASGIAAGLKAALAIEPQLQALIVAVCDQPYISAGLFGSLMEKHAVSGKRMIASFYSEICGTPVLFDKHYFNELAALAGDAGAKQLLKRHPDDVATVPFPKGSIDIDTAEDLKIFVNSHSDSNHGSWS
ncbi:MAG TPA: nucleotidyltransferase family protein [Puia sp.]|nr:nucleotidyltransferase family protein [Puia sp.]